MITTSPSGGVTIRQPGRCMQIAVYLAIACLLWVPGLIGIGFLIWLYSPAGLACVTVLVLVVAWGCIRAMRLDVRFDDGGVTVRNFWHTRRLRWDEVSHFADGGKDWWALKVVPCSGRPIEATGTTSGARGIVKTGVLDVIGQVAERYQVRADLSGRTPIAQLSSSDHRRDQEPRAAIAVAGQGDSRSMTTHDADSGGPSGLEDSRAGPQQVAEPEPDGDVDRADAQPPSRAVYGLSLACLICASGSVGLGITDLIAYRILAGYLVAVGMAAGAIAAILASITWFGMVAPRSAPGRQTEMVRRICRAGQLLGILGFICLVIGSGHGSAL